MKHGKLGEPVPYSYKLIKNVLVKSKSANRKKSMQVAKVKPENAVTSSPTLAFVGRL